MEVGENGQTGLPAQLHVVLGSKLELENVMPPLPVMAEKNALVNEQSLRIVRLVLVESL
jgi:hypothetical protein